MAGNKYLSMGTGGDFQEVASSQVSAGVGDAGKVVSLNGSGVIDATMLPEAVSTSLPTSENLATGAMVNIYSNAGVSTLRNADNTTVSKRAHGFVTASSTSPATNTITLGDGSNTGVSGLTIGTEYWLGTVGAVTSTIPTATGSIVQYIGIAKSATELEVRIKDVTIRA